MTQDEFNQMLLNAIKTELRIEVASHHDHLNNYQQQTILKLYFLDKLVTTLVI